VQSNVWAAFEDRLTRHKQAPSRLAGKTNIRVN
jgi:hypothetical protein